MATKRSATQVHPSRRDQIPNEPRRKKRKPDNAGAKSFKKAHPVNDLKSQIRSLNRLLEHNDKLPADVRVEKERALQTAQRELVEANKAKERSDMITRYHKIRFFDRQKASKRLKRAQKELESCEDSHGRRVELLRRVEDAKVNVNYAQYYPLDRHYVSLFPRQRAGDKEEGEEEVEGGSSKHGDVEHQGDSEMWDRVKQCMAEGTLDALRNGKLTESAMLSSSRKKRDREDSDTGSTFAEDKSLAAVEAKDAAQLDGKDESDDGFFE